MKVKVDLGKFAEEDSRDKLLNDSSKCHDEFNQCFHPFLLCMLGGIAIGVMLLISSFFAIDNNKTIIAFLAIIFLMVMALMLLIGGMFNLINGKYYSIMAYLKKLHDDEKKLKEVIK